MLKRSSFEKRVLSLVEGTSVVTASIQLSGQRECADSAIDATFEELVEGGMHHIYGPILQKLNVLAGRLASEVGAFSTPHLGGRVNEEITKAIAEIKAELEMR